MMAESSAEQLIATTTKIGHAANVTSTLLMESSASESPTSSKARRMLSVTSSLPKGDSPVNDHGEKCAQLPTGSHCVGSERVCWIGKGVLDRKGRVGPERARWADE